MLAAIRKSINPSYKNHLPLKVEIDRMEVIESLEACIEVVQSLICDLLAAVNKSTNSFYKSHLLLKIEIDGL